MKKQRKPVRKTAEERFYTALITLMKKNVYSSITVTDIAAGAKLSRMTFYRHFREIDDVLIRHLELVLSEAEAKIKDRRDLSKKAFWLELIRISREDPINEHLMEAGLLTKTFKSELRYMMRIYQTYFGLDMSDENAVVLVYRKLGALFGVLFYISTNNSHSDDLLANHIISIIENNNE